MVASWSSGKGDLHHESKESVHHSGCQGNKSALMTAEEPDLTSFICKLGCLPPPLSGQVSGAQGVDNIGTFAFHQGREELLSALLGDLGCV